MHVHWFWPSVSKLSFCITKTGRQGSRFFSKKLLKVQKAVVSKYKQLWRKKIWLIQDMTNHVILHYAKKAVTQAYYGGDFYVRPILICFLNYVIIFQLQLMLMPSDFFSIFYYTRKKENNFCLDRFLRAFFCRKPYVVTFTS